MEIVKFKLQGVPKNRAPFHTALVYFSLFANLNENIYALTIKRPKYSTICHKGCENQATAIIYFIKDSIYHQVAKVLLTRHFHRKVCHATQCYFKC